MIQYGAPPKNLGEINLPTKEMMCWLYVPLKIAGNPSVLYPDNLRQLAPFVDQCLNHRPPTDEQYVYLTAKTLFVTPQNLGNRPGWHSDGFGTDDLNFIWCDRFPTEFAVQEFHDIGTDEHKSMLKMTAQIQGPVVTYPCRNTLLLTPEVIHRVPIIASAGMRTFLKLSISTDIYNMEGNSRNHLFDYDWPMQERGPDRNTTAAKG